MATKRSPDDEREEVVARLDEMLKVAGLSKKSTYRIQEAAMLLGVTQKTIYRMTKNRELSFVRVRAAVRIDYGALVDLILNSPG
jgi:excisionase family DNA binding protein